MQATITSSHHATKLLQAWKRHDPSLIAAELDNTVNFCRSSVDTSSAEVERRELLAGIVEEIGRLSPSRRQGSEADTYVRLLEHLSR